jgi:hypothetical protein
MGDHRLSPFAAALYPVAEGVHHEILRFVPARSETRYPSAEALADDLHRYDSWAWTFADKKGCDQRNQNLRRRPQAVAGDKHLQDNLDVYRRTSH